MTAVQESPQHAIVVGVDGSLASVQAMRWAIRQAELTGAAVDAVTVWEYPIAAAAGFAWAPAAPMDSFNYAELAAKTLNECVNEARPPSSTAVVRQHVLEGSAGPVLLEFARNADLVVVGSRGHGEFTEALIGSVSQRCVHHANCPVVVVRGHRTGR